MKTAQEIETETRAARKTAAEVAKRYGVSLATVYRWPAEGCPVHRYGLRTYRFDFDEVDRWLQEVKAARVADLLRQRAERAA